MDNVILFPKPNKIVPPKSLEEIEKKAETDMIEVSESLSYQATTLLIDFLESYGFNMRSDPNLAKDIFYLFEVVNASILRHQNIDHPLQSVIEECISMDNPEKAIEIFYEVDE